LGEIPRASGSLGQGFTASEPVGIVLGKVVREGPFSDAQGKEPGYLIPNF